VATAGFYAFPLPGTDRAAQTNDGVVATFFLIRYQSVVASRSEINFARQFFRNHVFILAVQQAREVDLASASNDALVSNQKERSNDAVVV